MIGLPIGGISTDALSEAIAVLIGFTGLCGGVVRYAVVFAGRAKSEVERATAIGFFLGFGLGVLVLVSDALA